MREEVALELHRAVQERRWEREVQGWLVSTLGGEPGGERSAQDLRCGYRESPRLLWSLEPQGRKRRLPSRSRVITVAH